MVVSHWDRVLLYYKILVYTCGNSTACLATKQEACCSLLLHLASLLLPLLHLASLLLPLLHLASLLLPPPSFSKPVAPPPPPLQHTAGGSLLSKHKTP